ncbi:MAG: hypothetical protein BGO98_34350 [Myxococcales bacterium 68-20]|nr:hypothetical protein [Myxococcales bacterium]OJY25704.1 MAG: hypothetical protein BGO98_34350 [Myxococcales bacterium 68-20]
MKSLVFRIAGVSISMAAAVACVASGNDDETSAAPRDVPEGGTTVPTEDGGEAREAGPDGGAILDAGPDGAGSATCSPDGWCLTELPTYSDELELNDVWPLAGSAFAIAGTQLGSVRFLEWSDASNRWSAIDDDTLHYVDAVAGSVWAPNADEVYFTTSSWSSPGGLVHYGKRPIPPATDWSWKRFSFECNATETPRVWGTSKSDVFVMSCAKIHRLAGDADDAGASPWIEAYVDDDAVYPVTFHGATGTSRDDAWFVGTRAGGFRGGRCAVVVRKTAAGYEPVVDGNPSRGCGQKAGSEAIPIAGAFGRATGDAIHAPAKDRFIGVSFGTVPNNDVVRIAPNGAGGYAVDVTSPSPELSVALRSVWGASEDDLWFVVAPPTSTTDSFNASIVRGTNIWADGGGFQYSTLALNGLPNSKALQRIRGTSNTNLWAVGANSAFYKKTP